MGLIITGGINLTGNVTTSALFGPGQAVLASKNATYTGTANQANVSFTPPTSAGSLSITSHSAISTPGNIVGSVAQASAGNITVTGLTQGTSYTFKVFATTGIGNGAQSSDSTFPFIAGNVPATPTAPTASQSSSMLTAGKGTAIVTFTAPSNNGIPISSHTAQSSPDNIVSTVYQASSGDILVDGLTPGTAYTFTVFATNDAGSSASSPASGSVTPQVGQQVEYTTPGTYTWVAPAGLTTVSVVTVGGGATGAYYSQTNPGGGGGGGLGYANVSVTGGNSYTVVAANSGGQSYFSSNAVVAGNGGSTAWASVGPGGGFVGNGGGSGGFGGAGGGFFEAGGGGGGGGYSGNGGNGSDGGSGSNGANGAGGAGGGGGRGGFYGGSGGGGGVGIYGAGPNGVGGGGATGGGGGSSGTNGGSAFGWQNFYAGPGGLYGGGGGSTLPNNYNETPGTGGKGAVRIIWGTGRHYPSTNTANAFYSSANYPGTPTIGTVSLNGSDISVSYTAGSAGSFPIASHTAISTPGNITATVNQADSGSIVYTNSVALFTVGTSYTFKVFSTNLAGSSPQSAASASYTWSYGGQETQYIVAGTYTWVAPTGVSSISAVAVGGGGGGTNDFYHNVGGGGGGLGYANISVSAGNSYTVVVGTAGPDSAPGGNSYFANNSTLSGGGGVGGAYQQGVAGGSFTGNGGGNGGHSGPTQPSNWSHFGGGGAGGYSGKGGNGHGHGIPAENGAGGGGAGGTQSLSPSSGSGGGGVGIYGAGANGVAPSGGGSSGTNGGTLGGSFGGGGRGARGSPRAGGGGAVRIIWGTGRHYPSTNTANVAYGAPDIPSVPQSANATLSGGSIAVFYTAPSSLGTAGTSSHVAVSTPGNLVASVNQANSGAIQYGNVFTPGVTYSFNVYAISAAGRSPAATTNSLFYQGVGYQSGYIVPGTYTWVAPTGVTSVSTVAIGGGGSGYMGSATPGSHGAGGGGLGYANVSVTAGTSYTVVVGAGGKTTGGAWSGNPGGQSYFANTSTVAGNGGSSSAPGGGYVGNGGGNGGAGGPRTGSHAGGAGGGAGGYSGAGGNGGNSDLGVGANGSGGGGGGGSGTNAWEGGGGGGGVGIYGTGPTGLGATAFPGVGGGSGSHGSNGGSQWSWRNYAGGNGGLYGGGAGSAVTNTGGETGGQGGNGAVRIIWASPTYTTRTFPSANTQDVYR